MSDKNLVLKINRELDELIKQTESVLDNLRALRRLTEKKRKSRNFNICGVVVRIGENEPNHIPETVYHDEFDVIDDCKGDFS